MNALRDAIVRRARRGAPRGAGVVAPRPGDGLEFGQLRAYDEGDDPRRIDWAATARTGALQTRVYLDETVLVLAAIVDESASMTAGRRRPLAAAARDAVAAWFGAAEAGDRTQRLVGTRVVAERRAAIDVRAREPFRLRAALEFALRVVPRGASLLLVTDGHDLVEDDEGVLRRLALRADPTVLVARDPWHDGFPLRGFRRVRDLERGTVRRLWFGRRERARFVAAVAAREAAIVRRFRDAGWRVGTLTERDGAAAVERVFGVRS